MKINTLLATVCFVCGTIPCLAITNDRLQVLPCPTVAQKIHDADTVKLNKLMDLRNYIISQLIKADTFPVSIAIYLHSDAVSKHDTWQCILDTVEEIKKQGFIVTIKPLDNEPELDWTRIDIELPLAVVK